MMTKQKIRGVGGIQGIGGLQGIGGTQGIVQKCRKSFGIVQKKTLFYKKLFKKTKGFSLFLSKSFFKEFFF